MNQGRPIEDRRTILVTENRWFSAEAATLLRHKGELILADLDRDHLLCAIKDVDALWVRLRHRIDAEVLRAGSRLRVVATPTTGLNHIDVHEADRLGIQVVSLSGETAFLQEVRATAEHTVALILALLRSVPAASAHVREGEWNRDLFRGRELYGKTVGVVGLGRLGTIVAGYLRAFGAHVIAADPRCPTTEIDVPLLSLNEVLQGADIVSLHANLTDENRGFFGPAQFAEMRPGAWFVNTARGELVDEASLLAALRSGRLAGAALDVLTDERATGMAGHPLVVYARSHDNLIVTPHIGGCTEESMAKTEVFLARKLCAAL